LFRLGYKHEDEEEEDEVPSCEEVERSVRFEGDEHEGEDEGDC